MIDCNFLERFRAVDNKIRLNKYVAIVRNYFTADKDKYGISKYYLLNEDEVERLKSNYINKHKRLELQEVDEIDNTNYEWMEGIEINKDDIINEEKLKSIYSYGSKEAYQASLSESVDTMLLNMQLDIAKIKLGIE